MPSLVEDAWINGQASTHDVAELEDCAIAVDASYYLQLLLDTPPSHEPLLPALGGLTGIQSHIQKDLDQWKEHKIDPFFIFDGQSITGQEEVAAKRARAANQKTDEAWEMYFNSQAQEAVDAFGANGGAFQIQNLHYILKGLLKANGLHFLVPPYNASAQLAYFDMIDSDQCAGIMGSQDLLLYPIKDSVIKTIDWEQGTVTAISKKSLIRALNVSEAMFVDGLLMTGTSFLPSFPPLQDTTISPRQPSTVMDAVNMLRTSEKSITTACASFNDILQAQDPNWLDKYRKARMAVNHFIYIAENGEIKVNDYDRLTGDNHEYLGLQLPEEMFHYLNTGLIGPRVLSCITNGQILVAPTLDGVASDEYKQLITSQLVPVKEQTFALLIPRLHRGIQHKEITMKVWFDDKFSYTINHRSLQPNPLHRTLTWDVKQSALKNSGLGESAGHFAFEILSLLSPDFIKNTFPKEKRIKGIDSAENIVAVAIWRFLHLRGYVDDSHQLTNWGTAVASAIYAVKETVKEHPEALYVYEAIVVAFELIRFDLLNTRNKHEELSGLPMNGSEEDKASLLLISRVASLLKLRQEFDGYTGPLNKNLLYFRSLSTAVREADRDLIEAIVASMFLHAQSKRDREDQVDVNQKLPFLANPDIALGIAVKTLMDEISGDKTREQRLEKVLAFPDKYFPCATHFKEDIELSFSFFEAIHKGVQTLNKEISSADKAAWEAARRYLEERDF